MKYRNEKKGVSVWKKFVPPQDTLETIGFYGNLNIKGN